MKWTSPFGKNAISAGPGRHPALDLQRRHVLVISSIKLLMLLSLRVSFWISSNVSALCLSKFLWLLVRQWISLSLAGSSTCQGIITSIIFHYTSVQRSRTALRLVSIWPFQIQDGFATIFLGHSSVLGLEGLQKQTRKIQEDSKIQVFHWFFHFKIEDITILTALTMLEPWQSRRLAVVAAPNAQLCEPKRITYKVGKIVSEWCSHSAQTQSHKS